MRTRFIVLVVLVLIAVSAQAQVPAKPFSIYLQGGITLPSGPEEISDAYKMGYHFGGGLGIALGPMFQVVPKAEYHLIPRDFGDLDGDGLELSVILVGADLRANINLPAAPIKPFLIGGGGMAISKTNDGTMDSSPFEQSDSQSDFYFNVGGGLNLSAGPGFSPFIQVRYVSISTEGDDIVTIPVSLGLKF